MHLKAALARAMPVAAGLALAAGVRPASAASNDPLTNFGSSLGMGNKGLVQIIASLINQAMGLLGIILVCLFVYAGFLWMTAAGNEEKVSKAKAILTSSVIGLIIIMSAYSIAQFVVGGISNATQ